MPTLSRVSIEAIFVAVGLILLFMFISMLCQYKTNKKLLIIVGASGAVFHFICELSGLNKWYVKNYSLT